MTLPEIFFNSKQAREMANHSSQKKNQDKKERGKKKFKSRKAFDQIFSDFCTCLGQNVLNAILVARTAG